MAENLGAIVAYIFAGLFVVGLIGYLWDSAKKGWQGKSNENVDVPVVERLDKQLSSGPGFGQDREAKP